MTSVLPNAYKSVKKAAASQKASITTWAVMFIRLVEELITRLESLPPKASFLSRGLNWTIRYSVTIMPEWRRR